eukprot:11793243-Ditylum_brightwellii.AAC.1
MNYLDYDKHGKRKGRSAIDIVLGKVFTFDTAHFQHTNFGCTNCNTKACYDRIVPIILLLAYFMAGVFGIGQGSTDGPPGWTFISDIILK